MKLLSWIKKIDIFGRSVELRLDKKKVHKTYCGAAMTLIVFIITIAIVFIYINQYTQHENPFLSIYDIHFDDQLLLNSSLEDSDFLKIQLADKSSSTDLGAESFIIKSIIVSSTPNKSDYKESQVSFKKCKDDNSANCIDKNTDIYLEPYNPMSDDPFQYLEISIYDCATYQNNKGLSTSSCLTSNKWSSPLAIVSFIENTIIPSQYDNPISQEKRKLEIDLTKQKQEIDVYFKQLFIVTDKGIVWEDLHSISVLTFSSIEISTSASSSATTPIATIRILLDPNAKYFKRTYSKIQVYLAYIGGILKMVAVMGEFFTRPFVRLSLNTKIINEIFDFEGEDLDENSEEFKSDEIPDGGNFSESPLIKKRGLSILSLKQKISQPGSSYRRSRNYSQQLVRDSPNLELPMIKLQKVGSLTPNKLRSKTITTLHQTASHPVRRNTNTTHQIRKSCSQQYSQKQPQKSCLHDSNVKANSDNPPIQQIFSCPLSLEKITEQTINISPGRVQDGQGKASRAKQVTPIRQKTTSIQESQSSSFTSKEDSCILPDLSSHILTSDRQNLRVFVPNSSINKQSKVFPSHQLAQSDRIQRETKQDNGKSLMSVRVEKSSNEELIDDENQIKKSKFSPIKINKNNNSNFDEIAIKLNNIESQKNDEISPSPKFNSCDSTSKKPSMSAFETENKSNLGSKIDLSPLSTLYQKNKLQINISNQHKDNKYTNEQNKQLELLKVRSDSRNSKSFANQDLLCPQSTKHFEEQSSSVQTDNLSPAAVLDGVHRMRNSTLYSQSLFFPDNEWKGINSVDALRMPQKVYSTRDKQKIVAATEIMNNYQNNKQTPADTLKNFKKLIDTSKKAKNADSIFKKLFRQGKTLKMRFHEYILYYLQCFNNIYSEKKQQLRFSKKKVKERLDVVYIIQKLVEIDKLKILLLNEEQLKLFEYLPKPIVHTIPKDQSDTSSLKAYKTGFNEIQEPQNMQEAWSMLHQQKKPIQKATEASRVYQKMMEKDEKDLSLIDIKLIGMLDIRIKDIFHVNNELQKQKLQSKGTFIQPFDNTNFNNSTQTNNLISFPAHLNDESSAIFIESNTIEKENQKAECDITKSIDDHESLKQELHFQQKKSIYDNNKNYVKNEKTLSSNQ